MLAVCTLAFAACAARAPTHKLPAVDERDLARNLRCASQEVAFCAGTDCRPAHYRCVSRERVFGTIWADPPR